MVLKKRKKCCYINNHELCRVRDKERKCQSSSLVLMHLADAPLDWHFESLERLVTCFTCISLCLSSYCVAVGPAILFVEATAVSSSVTWLGLLCVVKQVIRFKVARA